MLPRAAATTAVVSDCGFRPTDPADPSALRHNPVLQPDGRTGLRFPRRGRASMFNCGRAAIAQRRAVRPPLNTRSLCGQRVSLCWLWRDP